MYVYNVTMSQRAFILVLEYVGNFGVSLVAAAMACLCVRMLSLYATG